MSAPELMPATAGPAARVLQAIARGIAAVGGIVILAMMLVAVLDVALRYLFNAPLSSAYEILQLGMVLVVYCGLAWCGLTGGHITVNFLGALLDHPRMRWIAALVHATGAALFLLVAWRSGASALDTFASGETTNMIKAPLAPFIGAVAAGSLLYAATLAHECVQALRGTDRSDKPHA